MQFCSVRDQATTAYLLKLTYWTFPNDEKREAMNRTRFVAIAFFGLALLTARDVVAQDLSSYRTFRFGSSLESVARETGMTVAEAKTIHSRPALIQELEWWVRPSLEPSSPADSVKAIVFSFYNDQLFRIAVNYNLERTKGLTSGDMIESISAKYGFAKRPPAKTVSSSSSQTYGGNEKVIACWEDPQYSFNLYHSSYDPAFGLVAYAKRLDVLAQAASAKAVRQDEQEAPGRLKQQAEESRIAQEKARSSNKTTFRP